jgi:hypothetical protein
MTTTRNVTKSAPALSNSTKTLREPIGRRIGEEMIAEEGIEEVVLEQTLQMEAIGEQIFERIAFAVKVLM